MSLGIKNSMGDFINISINFFLIFRKLRCRMEIIKLNVGGKKFTTLKSTLLKCKNSYLADLLEKEKDKIIYDENKAVFIDRNPKYFEFIIEYLRTGFMETLPQDFHTLKRLTDEALFYKLDGLSQEMYLTFLPSVIAYCHPLR